MKIIQKHTFLHFFQPKLKELSKLDSSLFSTKINELPKLDFYDNALLVDSLTPEHGAGKRPASVVHTDEHTRVIQNHTFMVLTQYQLISLSFYRYSSRWGVIPVVRLTDRIEPPRINHPPLYSVTTQTVSLLKNVNTSF